MDNDKLTPIRPQGIQHQSPSPSTSNTLLLEAIARRLAEAKSEQHIHYHAAPIQPSASTPSQGEQNTHALFQAVAGLAIVFCLTFGALSTIILIWRGAQATAEDYRIHTTIQ